MSLFDALRYRARVFLNGRAHEQELAEELEFHLALEARQREHAARGALSPQDAQHAARRRFGNTTWYQEEVRRTSGLGFFDTIRQDLQFALRSLRGAPVFTAVAVLTLAAGIGGNTAIFSAVHALLLRPLPFHAPERLMHVNLTVQSHVPGKHDVTWSHPKFLAFRESQNVFSNLTHWTSMHFTIRVGEAVRESGEFIDSEYLPTLGVLPLLGRNLSAEEDRYTGGPRVVLLSYDLWHRAYDGSQQILGEQFDIDGVAYTIIGITPPGFHGLSGKAHFWVPLVTRPPELVNEPQNHNYFGVGRLAPGVSPEQADAAAALLGNQVGARYPSRASGEQWSARARELDKMRVDPRLRRTLLVLFSAAGLVLLIACANVANLFLVRASTRRREIAVRLALGAGRARLVRQLLVESVLLATMGGAASVIVAWWGVKLLSAVNAAGVLSLTDIGGVGTVNFTTLQVNGTALAFTAALALGTGLLFGLVPALQSTKLALTDALKDAKSRPSFGLQFVTSRNALVVGEIALAVVLLSASGLMIRSLAQLLAVRNGFDADQVLVMRVNRAPLWSRDSIVTFYDRALQRLAALPGVTDVAMSDCPPLNNGCFDDARIALLDRPPVPTGAEPLAVLHWVTPSWVSLLRVPLLRGRDFTRADVQNSQRVVLVNETAARTFWPGQDPIGKPIAEAGHPADTAWVVGVVGDVQFRSIDAPPIPDIYSSYYQVPLSYRMMLHLRTRGDPVAMAGAARAALRQVAPGFPIYEVGTLKGRVAAASEYARLSALLLSLFAVVALVLATIGVYGVISYATAQRTTEISVRVTLGATRSQVARLVVFQGLALLAVGAAAGLAGALAGTRLLRSVLFEVEPADPATLAAMVCVIAVAVLLASWIPARRAARASLMHGLRSD